MAHAEDALGDKGTVSGSLYAGDHAHYHFLGEVFDLYSHANVLQRDMYPSATKFEGEIIAMTSDLLHGTGIGVVTSGGSESLMTALYSYREEARARAWRHQAEPRDAGDGALLPRQGRALDGRRDAPRAAHRRLRRRRRRPWPTSSTTRPSPSSAAPATTRTASSTRSRRSPSWRARARDRPARRRLPRRLAAPLGRAPRLRRPALGLPRARRHLDLRRHAQVRLRAQGLQRPAVPRQGAAQAPVLHRSRPGPAACTSRRASPGSRSGGILASTWAALVATGESGYLAAADAIMRTATTIKRGDPRRHPRARGDRRSALPHRLQGGGRPRHLPGQRLAHRPGLAHDRPADAAGACTSASRARTRAPGLAEAYLEALRVAVEYAKEHKGKKARSGAVYGFAGTSLGTEMVKFTMARFLDAMHDVPDDPGDRVTWASPGSSPSTSATAGPRSPSSRSTARSCAWPSAPSARASASTGRRPRTRSSGGPGCARRRARRSPAPAPTATRLHVVAITGQYGSSVPVGADGEPVGEVLLWADTRARDLAREVIGGPLSIGGFAPHKVLPVRAHHRRGAVPERGRPHRTLAVAPRAAARRLREDRRSSSSRWTTSGSGSPAARRPPRRRCSPRGSPTTASGRRSGTSDSLLVRTRRDRSKLPELVPTGSVLGPLLPEVAGGARGRRRRARRVRHPRSARRRRGLGRDRPLRHAHRHLHHGVDQRPCPLQAHRHPAPDRHRARASTPRIPSSSTTRRRAGAALHWLREQIVAPDDGLLGGGSGIGARGRRRRGPGAVVRRPDPARRAGPARAARACCSCPGSTANAVRRRTRPCAPAG